MKALILAAGFGTRLAPHTDHTPKPLFTVGGRTVLDRLIDALAAAGAQAVAVNTHHLHERIERHVARQHYPLPVTVHREAQILGTGGAIRNLSAFWDTAPFMVVNSDIVTDIDLRAVYAWHLAHPGPVTMVLHDCPRFNQVSVNAAGEVVAFHSAAARDGARGRLAFTGIQVIDPQVLAHIPAGRFVHIIDVYRDLLAAGRKIRACVQPHPLWHDIGTAESYRKAVIAAMAPQIFARLDPLTKLASVDCRVIEGDGSDRAWFRLQAGDRSLVLADHGLRAPGEKSEAEAFVAIGRHLSASGVPVPVIYDADTFAGLVFVEDLGDRHLQAAVNQAAGTDELLGRYRRLVEILVRMSLAAGPGFDPRWAWQSPHYDRQLILEKECRYFIDAFINGYLGRAVRFADLRPEFERLAERTLRFGLTGFMHRDLQARNIMLKNDDPYLIDFQGGRLGPLQYDLASLLLDPYVALPENLQAQLAAHCLEQVGRRSRIDAQGFMDGYVCCRLTRNLQILGAFGYLTRVKRRPHFERYIPTAVRTLQGTFQTLPPSDYPGLRALAAAL